MTLNQLITNISCVSNFTPERLQSISTHLLDETIESLEIVKKKVNGIDVSQNNPNWQKLKTFSIKFCETLICAFRLRKGLGNGIEVCQDVATIIRNATETIVGNGNIIREG